MPRIIITEGATQGLERCRLFLAEKNPLAAARAARAIAQQFELLETEPEIGRPWEELPKLRELLIPFGDSGYVALYRYEPDDNALYVLAFRHQKEAGY
ncbi:MAG: type II toxin-antitoxin system RelE/ParE family toxin [Gammaproteobacteria bacterium]|nr:type II toxin-antitoxin system RelE/ParE family toxin [Gammaproteobacteria bacterium]